MEKLAKKHEEYERKLARLADVERHNKDLEAELVQAEMDRKQAEKEKEDAISGVLKAKSAREKEILRVFKRAAAKEVDVDEAPKPKEPKSEFLPNGLKAVPAAYDEMDVTDLLNLQAVDPNVREAIANDIFVELKELSGADVQVVQHKVQTQQLDENGKPVYLIVGAAPKNQDPKTRPQFFHALYTWGQYYLQCYPTKSAAFLEYMLFISKYGVVYSVPNLLVLDRKIRKFYTENPTLQWDMAGKHVTRFVREADLEILLNNLQMANNNSQYTPQKSRTQYIQQNQNQNQTHQSSGKSGQSWGKRSKNPGSGRGDRRSGGGKSSKRRRDSRKSDRCKNWNFRECNDPDCPRDHVCFTCGSYNHKAEDCPQRYDRYRSDYR